MRLGLVAVLSVFAAAAWGASAAQAAPALPGVPTGTSLLFALESGSGTLTPKPGAKKKGRFVLSLKGVRARTTWFSDRPQREAGRVSSRRLFAAWRALGFRASPPNAALVVDRARAGRDTMAVELELRGYNPHRNTARFAVRTLGSLGNGLAHVNRRLDRRVASRFGNASLFIDNAAYGNPGCTVGQPQLMAIDQPAFDAQRAQALSQGQQAIELEAMTRANGQVLQINSENLELELVYRMYFGDGDGDSFRVPYIGSPPAASWFICINGRYPRPDDLGPCDLGEIAYWFLPNSAPVTDSNYQPADGRSLSSSSYPQYASAYAPGQDTFQLPNVPAPRGMVSLACVKSDGALDPDIGQVDLYPGPPSGQAGSRLPLEGQQLSSSRYPSLNVITELQYHSRSGRFTLPALSGPVAGTSYWVAANGNWPVD